MGAAIGGAAVGNATVADVDGVWFLCTPGLYF